MTTFDLTILDYSETKPGNKAKALYLKMRAGTWESSHYPTDNLAILPKSERQQVKNVLGYLIALDSLQAHALPELTKYLQDAWDKTLLNQHTNTEFLHALSYQDVAGSLSPKHLSETYHLAEDDPELKRRMELVLEPYKYALEDPTDVERRAVALLADYLLEGVLFSHGFLYFCSKEELYPKTLTTIAKISDDESMHVGIFHYLLTKLLKEAAVSTDLLVDKAMAIADHEIAFLPRLLPHLPEEEVINSLHWLMGNRLKALKLEYPYKTPQIRPFKEFWSVIDTSSQGSTVNMLEMHSPNYVNAANLDWSGFE